VDVCGVTWRCGEFSVVGEQGKPEGLSERDVHRVVGREVVAHLECPCLQLPHCVADDPQAGIVGEHLTRAVGADLDVHASVKDAHGVAYGLGGGLWTSDLSRAHKAARELRAGMVWVNSYKRENPGLPFGGVGVSRYGREMGFESMREYTEPKATWINVDITLPPFYPRG
jgi:hypothetical protein